MSVGLDLLEKKYNETDMEYDVDRTIQSLFEEKVKVYGNQVAVIYRDQQITYEELNQKSNQVARLLRDNGIKPNMIVGIMVNRSAQMFIGLLGILKAGACYLPIDPKFPTSRINYMLEDSKAELLITEHNVVVDFVFSNKKIYLDDDIYHDDTNNLENVNSSSDLAYVIYTSGSTGKPKGVMLEHRLVHNFIIGMKDKIEFTRKKRIASLTTISFDIFVLESWLPLSLGMTIVIVDPMTFARDMGRKRVEMIQTTPSTMRLILDNQENHKYLDSLTDIMLGGEAFPQRLLRDLKKLVKAKIYNMYGPTETTVWSMVKDLTDTDFITIGEPIANTQVCLIDSDYKPVELGCEGEIAIAGDGVARGYLYREELTKERFIPSAFDLEKRMYRTGDLGKRLENGEIEFLGRIDSQVKVRGFRIELEEIENALVKMEQVKECVVSTKKNKNDEKYLVAYYVADEELANTEIIQFLKKTLPEYMIPGVFIKIDSIPLTPNGKVNHLVLPTPQASRPVLSTKYIEPSTAMERMLVRIWANVLNFDEIGVEDNFFDLGGNSILVSQIYVELEKQFGNKIDVTDLFIYPTISQMCDFLSNIQKQGERENRIEPIILEDSYYLNPTNEVKVHNFEYTINKDTASIFTNYAVAKQLDVNMLYLSTYMYFISAVTGRDVIEVLGCEGKEESYRKFHYDFSLSFDLDEMCKNMMEHKANKERWLVDSFNKTLKEEDKALIFTVDFDSDTIECKENEVQVAYHTVLDIIELKVRFHAERLVSSKLDELFRNYINLLDATALQMQGGNDE